jgi:hypothetical protein
MERRRVPNKEPPRDELVKSLRESVRDSFVPMDEVLLLDAIARIRSQQQGPQTDELARVVLRDFNDRQAMGLPQSAVTLEWLAEALEKVMNCEDPLAAFGFQHRPKHRPADEDRIFDIGWWVALAQLRGYTRAEAIKLAAATFASDAEEMDLSYIRKIVKKFDADAILDYGKPAEAHWEKVFEARARPLPAKKE